MHVRLWQSQPPWRAKRLELRHYVSRLIVYARSVNGRRTVFQGILSTLSRERCAETLLVTIIDHYFRDVSRNARGDAGNGHLAPPFFQGAIVSRGREYRGAAARSGSIRERVQADRAMRNTLHCCIVWMRDIDHPSDGWLANSREVSPRHRLTQLACLADVRFTQPLPLVYEITGMHIHDMSYGYAFVLPAASPRFPVSKILRICNWNFFSKRSSLDKNVEAFEAREIEARPYILYT